MSDPARTDPPRATDAAADADRNAKIEQLLLLGLDQYFAGNYDQAINIWTRALFLDRSHARARAYIERARTAQAEHQRQSEELLQTGLAAFERGESAEARRLLERAIGQGAPRDEALPVLDRLDRLEHSAPASSAAIAPAGGRPRTAAIAAPTPSLPRRVFVVAAAAVIIAAGGFAIATRRAAPRPFTATANSVFDVFSLLDGAGRAAPDVPPVDAGLGLGLPRRGEAALARAQALQASGHLRDALTALDGIRLTDPERADGDRLRADIQRQLLALAAATGTDRVP